MIGGFHDIIYVNRLVGDANGVCLKNILCLIVRKSASLDMIGIICHVNLNAVIYAAFYLAVLLFSQSLQQCTFFLLEFSFWQFGISWNIPSFSIEESSFDFTKAQ